MADFKDLSLEDLEKALEESKKNDKRKQNTPPSSKLHKTVLDYIKDKGIAQGEYKIPSSVIFYDYRANYPGQNSLSKIGRVSFFHTFSQYFTQKRDGKSRYYMININMLDDSDILEKSINYSKNLKRRKK